MHQSAQKIGLAVSILLWSCGAFCAPETINIQGSFADPNGDPVVGTRAYQVQFFDSEAGGELLGEPIEGFVTVSASGRFSLDLIPPEQVFDATDVYYQLGIDSGIPTDGSVDPEDLFPGRVKVNSVLFAHTLARQGFGSGLDADLLDGVDSSAFAAAGHSHNLENLAGTVTDEQVPDDITIEHAATADTATTANALSGSLSNQGDQIPLGEGVFLQVGTDGVVELLAGDTRLRLARQEWFDPRNLSDFISPDGSNAFDAQVALNDNDNAVIVWSQSDDGMQSQIFRSHKRNGSWNDPSRLFDNISPDGQDAFRPKVALNDNDESVVVWRQSDGLNFQIFRSQYRNGLWSDPSGLTDNISPDGQDTFIPRVALNDNGDAVIVWPQSDGMSNQIFRSENRNGSWNDPTSLSDNISPNGQAAALPQVALSENGDALIVWEQSDGTNSRIYRSEHRNGAWSDPSGLNGGISPMGSDAKSPRVAMSDNGDAVIVWDQSDGAKSQIFRSEYRNGVWSDPTGLTDNISPDGQDAFVSKVAMNANGEAVIVWQQSDGANIQIFRSEYRNGSWIDPAGLSDNLSPDGGTASEPWVAMNGNGEAVIVWKQSDDSGLTQIFRSEYRNGFWIDPAGLSDNLSPDGNIVGTPHVAINENGNALIGWNQTKSAYDHIFRSEFRFGF
jgi:hypothetical protein